MSKPAEISKKPRETSVKPNKVAEADSKDKLSKNDADKSLTKNASKKQILPNPEERKAELRQSTQLKMDKHPSQSKILTDSQVDNQPKKRQVSKSPQRSVSQQKNPTNKEEAPLKKYEQIMGGRQTSKPQVEVSKNKNANKENEPAKATVTKDRDSKSKDLKKSTEYKAETLDLCQRLNEYTKFKENVNLLNQPEPPKKEAQLSISVSSIDQAKERAESFLRKQIDNFKDKKKPNPTPPADLHKVVQPRLKKPPVELVNHCSFQPLLAKKSMEIIDKIVSNV